MEEFEYEYENCNLPGDYSYLYCMATCGFLNIPRIIFYDDDTVLHSNLL